MREISKILFERSGLNGKDRLIKKANGQGLTIKLKKRKGFDDEKD
jgi:hypothetical protein